MPQPTRVSPFTAVAAALMALTVVVHVVMGGPEVHDPLLVIVQNPVLGAFVSILWHAVTVVLIVLAVGLALLSRKSDPALELVLSGIQIGFALLFIGYGASRLGTLMIMPQWIIFLLVPALTRLGQAQRERLRQFSGTSS